MDPLPNDILYLIFRYMDVYEVFGQKLFLVCRRWNSILRALLIPDNIDDKFIYNPHVYRFLKEKKIDVKIHDLQSMFLGKERFGKRFILQQIKKHPSLLTKDLHKSFEIFFDYKFPLNYIRKIVDFLEKKLEQNSSFLSGSHYDYIFEDIIGMPYIQDIVRIRITPIERLYNTIYQILFQLVLKDVGGEKYKQEFIKYFKKIDPYQRQVKYFLVWIDNSFPNNIKKMEEAKGFVYEHSKFPTQIIKMYNDIKQYRSS